MEGKHGSELCQTQLRAERAPRWFVVGRLDVPGLLGLLRLHQSTVVAVASGFSHMKASCCRLNADRFLLATKSEPNELLVRGPSNEPERPDYQTRSIADRNDLARLHVGAQGYCPRVRCHPNCRHVHEVALIHSISHPSDIKSSLIGFQSLVHTGFRLGVRCALQSA
jgi:hypothetical protein